MTSTKSRATGEGLRCGGKTAANSKSIRGRKWRATTPRLANSCAVNGSQIATPSPDDTNPHMISDRLVSTRRTRRTSSRLKAWSIRWRPVDPAVSDTKVSPSKSRGSSTALAASRWLAGKIATRAGAGSRTHGRPEWAIGTSAKPMSHWWFKTQSTTIGEITPKNDRLRFGRSFRNPPANRGK